MGNGKISYRSKWVYFFIALFFGTWGFQKIYARKYGKFVFWILLYAFLVGCELEPLMFVIVFIDMVSMIVKSEENFIIYCNKKYFKGMSKEEKLSAAKLFIGEHNREVAKNYAVSKTASSSVTQPAIKVPGEDKDEAETHNHIKEDARLSAYVEKSQDKMDRFQNNNYFPSVDSSKTYDRKTRSERIEELKNEYKDGLISKEDYNEALRNL